MNLLDSSAWPEFFADGPLAGKFSAIASEPESVLVPTVVLYEVFKVVMRERGETEALQAVAALRLILATAHLNDATLWTMDEHFKDLPQVRYFSPRS